MIRLRSFRPDDLPAVLRIEKACFVSDAWPAALFRHYAAACPRLFLVAVAEGRIAGYSITCVTKNTAELDSVAVLPRFRGRGIAWRLLQKSIRGAQRLGAVSISLMVRRDNDAAIFLYKKAGFTRVATVAGYYEDGASAWRMRFALDTAGSMGPGWNF